MEQRAKSREPIRQMLSVLDAHRQTDRQTDGARKTSDAVSDQKNRTV